MDHTNPIPSGMRQVQRPSALPLYFAAAVWLIFGLFLPMYKLSHLLLAALLSAAAWLAGRKLCKPVTVLEPIPYVPSQNPELERMRSEGADAILQMAQSNAGIASPEISGKIDRLIYLTQQILTRVEQHPNQLPQIRKFMNYYLPTTLKLLQTYDRYDETPELTENIAQMLINIGNILDTILSAFQKQLDKLLLDETLDISTDITVLQGMLAQEGLGGDDFRLS